MILLYLYINLKLHYWISVVTLILEEITNIGTTWCPILVFTYWHDKVKVSSLIKTIYKICYIVN